MDAQVKRCPKCSETKVAAEFFRNRTTHDGLSSYCKLCQMVAVSNSVAKKPEHYAEKQRRAARAYGRRKRKDPKYLAKKNAISIEWVRKNRERRKEHLRKYGQSRKAWFAIALSGIKQRTKRRGHSMGDFENLEVFTEWALANGFDYLWEKFLESGRNKDYRPSVDRIDNLMPYTKENTRLVTWAQNRDEWNDAQRAGVMIRHKNRSDRRVKSTE